MESTELRTELPFGRSHAFIIGIDQYEHVPPLQTAVSDASKLAEVLEKQQHFLVHPPLLNAKGEAIRDLLHKTLGKGQEIVGKDDRVIFYFAGHGTPADGDDGPAGFILPADAESSEMKTFIPMEDLHQCLDALPCRHLLLILDCCFSGAFKWSSQHRAIGTLMPKKIYKERFDRFIQEPAWQVLTSAAYDQKALDVLKGTGKLMGARGRADLSEGAHSPFAFALFEGLAGAADFKVGQEGDGVITATELYAYIRDQIEPATIEESQKLRQTPGFFPLRKHDKGEFIFLNPNSRFNLPAQPKRNPYKGLHAFNEADKELFYGRNDVIKEMRAKAESNKLLVVSGVSGAGKSSVVNAGLVPELRHAGFQILPAIRPGVSPLASLEQALKEAGIIESAAMLQDGAFMKKLGEAKTVLVIDQYEELITHCPNPTEREQFNMLLRQLLDEAPEGKFKLILSVRADFEPQLTSGALQSLWNSGRYHVPPCSFEALKEIIFMPTMQEVLIFDPPELVDKILETVVQAPGALPLVSHTLSELYEAYIKSGREDRAFKQEDYDKLGGVVGVLRTKADELYHSLDIDRQNTMRKLMLRMVSVEGEWAGKRVLRRDLIYAEAAENQRMQAMIEQLVAARLVVNGPDGLEPAHDTLVRDWKTLREWVHTIGEDKILLNDRVNVAAHEFAGSQNVKFLWHDNPHLSVLQQEVNNPKHWFNAQELDFIQKSVRRKIKLARILRSIVAGVLVALSALTVWALISRAEAIMNAKKDRASRLTTEANQILPNDPTLALRLAEAAYELFHTKSETKVQKALSDAFHSQEQNPFYVASYPHNEQVTATAFSPDGQYILTATIKGLAKLWDLQGNLLQRFQRDDFEIKEVYFSTVGDQIFTVSRDSTIRLWNVNGAFLDSVKNHAEGSRVNFGTNGTRIVLQRDESELERRFKAKTAVAQVSVSADQKRILTFMANGSVVLWDETETLLQDLGRNKSAVFARTDDRILLVSEDGVVRLGEANGNIVDSLQYHVQVAQAIFSPDGKRILTTSDDRLDHTVKLWDLSQPLVHRLSLRGKAVQSVVFDPDGKRILTAGFDATVVLWNEQGERIDSLHHNGVVNAAIFSANGKRVLTASRDSTAKLWTPGKTPSTITFPHHGAVNTAVFSPTDSTKILTASTDDTARLWSSQGQRLRTFAHHGNVRTAEFAADGQQILTASQDGTARLWKLNGDTVATFSHRGPVNAAIFSPKAGMRILTVSADSTANLWQRNGTLITSLPHENRVRFALYSPDGRYFFTAAGKLAKLWDAKGKLVANLEHRFTVTAAAFSLDNAYLLTATSEGSPEEEESAVLWNLKGKRLVNFGGHRQQVNAIAFSPEGRRFVTASTDGSAMIWWLPETIFTWLKTAPVYRLTAEDKQYFEIER